jgi:hypothetical protein
MYLILTSLYPNDKAREVANMYVKMITKYPDDASLCTPTVPVAVRATLQGIRVLSIQEVKKGKASEAHAFVANRLAMFNDIQGYRWTIKTYLNLEEALKTIGM